MRLVNIWTYQLRECIQGRIPPYAILSHRWTDEELTFKELAKGRADTSKKGYQKLLGACEAAKAYNVAYVWIDTCCIDKRSSAELSESINSMFAWYRDARVCLAYLEDVSVGPELDEMFRKSVWFTRAWTLQELLAPERVEFYDGQWERLGSKLQRLAVLADITSVAQHVLSRPSAMMSCSVSERMSWAADRHATRTEDVAYSLIGIFDVNLPLLYGEGDKAFGRLQEEILRRSSDTTLLAWGQDDDSYRLLARHPADFRDLRGLELRSTLVSCRFGITNVGLEIYARVVRWDLNTFGILLGEAGKAQVTHLLLVRKYLFESCFYRVGVTQSDTLSTAWRRERRLLVMWGTGEQDCPFIADLGIQHGFHVRTSHDFKIVPLELKRGGGIQVRASELKTVDVFGYGFTFGLGNPIRRAVATLVCHHGQTSFWMDLAFDFDGRPSCLIYRNSPSDWRQIWQVSETTSAPEVLETSGTLLEKQTMSAVPDSHTGTTSYFLRHHSRGSATWSNLPAEVIGGDRQAYILFSPGHLANTSDPGLWSFGISFGAPKFDRRGCLA